MATKSSQTRKLYSGLQGQFDGTPSLRKTFTVTETLARDGTQLPMYKSLIKTGSNATTSMQVRVQNVCYRKGYCSVIGLKNPYSPKRQGQEISTNIFDNWSPTAHTQLPGTLFMSQVQNNALIGIIKKIRTNETSGLSGPTFIGELRETIKMIKSPVNALRLKTGLFTDLQMRILRDKQARGRKAEEKWSKIISDTYLEWTFGVKPLMGDISEILQMATDMKTKRLNGLKRLSHTYSDDQRVHEGRFVAGWAGVGVSIPYQLWSVAKSSSNYVVWVDEDLIGFPSGSMDRVIQASKFDFYEVIPTAWELLPWSFLIDYWTNIGDVLGCTFNYNRNVAFGKLTGINQVIRFHAPGAPIVGQPEYYAVTGFEPWTYTSTYKRIDRSALTTLGFPSLDFSLPSIGQSINMAALVVSLSKSNPFRGFTLK